MSINRRLDKLWYINIIKYYAAWKKDKLLPHPATQMELTNKQDKEGLVNESIHIKFKNRKTSLWLLFWGGGYLLVD